MTGSLRKREFPWRLGALALLVLCVSCEAERAAPEGYQGVVELDERMLAFEVGGRLLEVTVRQGDVVAPGDAIARLDSTLPALELRALEAQAEATRAELDLLYEGARPENIKQARARVKSANASFQAALKELDRAETLLRSGTATGQYLDQTRLRLDQARAAKVEAELLLKELRQGPREQEIEAGEARLDAARSSAESARERIRRHELFADGHAEVLDVPRRFGEYVAPGTTIVTVADTTRPFVDVFVPQPEVSKLSVGAPVTVRVDSLSAALGGRVEHIARTMEYSPRFLFSPAERPYLVLRARIRIRDDDRKIHAGIPGFVTLGNPAGLPLPEAPRTVTKGTAGAPDEAAKGPEAGGDTETAAPARPAPRKKKRPGRRGP